MSQIFTHGRWTVTEGKEQEFVDAWSDLADWTSKNIEGAGWVKLLRDKEHPNVFLSFGPWDDMSAIQRWRADPGFVERIANMRGMLDDFEAHVLESAAEYG